MATGYFIGLMSGTSVDSVDAALLYLETDTFNLIDTCSVNYQSDLSQSLLALKSNPSISLATIVELEHRISATFAEAANSVILQANKTPADITAIGAHGQTVFHLPHGPYPGTLQLGDPSLIAARTGIDVIADFRRADMAVGGQGAPLAPAFHRFALGSNGAIVLNLGGIANITVLNEPTIGFDTGPANSLLDQCIQTYKQERFDDHGTWARTGKIDEILLSSLLQDPYFHAPAPKSTGTEYFNLNWVNQHLGNRPIEPNNLQRTLLELTAVTIALEIRKFVKPAGVYICGGGIKNVFLVGRLQQHLPNVVIRPLDDAGVSAEACECCTFAWLASRFLQKKSGNIPSVTGAREPAVLGALYPSLSGTLR